MRTSSAAAGIVIAMSVLLGGCSGKHGDAAAKPADGASPATPAVAAATMPKPGLWEMTVSGDGMPQPMKTTMCMGAPAPGANPFAPPPQAGQACTRNGFTQTATGYSIDVECKMNGMTMSTKGDVSGDFSSDYKTVMKTKMGGPGIPAAMQTERTSTAEAKYMGACPADMKPGSMKVAS